MRKRRIRRRITKLRQRHLVDEALMAGLTEVCDQLGKTDVDRDFLEWFGDQTHRDMVMRIAKITALEERLKDLEVWP